MTLIKITLSDTRTYYMFLMHVLASVMEKLDRLQRNFMWLQIMVKDLHLVNSKMVTSRIKDEEPRVRFDGIQSTTLREVSGSSATRYKICRAHLS